jgi:predicted nuclease of predicted toxin-antitoxin system
MRILLDECVNPRVKAGFPDHDTKTVVEMGWQGTTNGKLLALAEANQFDVFLTLDQNLCHQQNIAARKLGLIVVEVPDNNIKFYQPLFSELNAAAEAVKTGEVIYVSSPLLPNRRLEPTGD